MVNRKQNKGASTKKVRAAVSRHGPWVVCAGRLVPAPGRPRKVKSLFHVVAEKIPFECLNEVKRDMLEQGLPTEGIYLAHDSMGVARYAGRGSIFDRLRARRARQRLELVYFSFYVVLNKNHEREIETLIIRATSHMLDFNDRKKRASILPGAVNDYEPGTRFYQRQYKRGRRT